jgi:hypothetical protein
VRAEDQLDSEIREIEQQQSRVSAIATLMRAVTCWRRNWMLIDLRILFPGPIVELEMSTRWTIVASALVLPAC